MGTSTKDLVTSKGDWLQSKKKTQLHLKPQIFCQEVRMTETQRFEWKKVVRLMFFCWLVKNSGWNSFRNTTSLIRPLQPAWATQWSPNILCSHIRFVIYCIVTSSKVRYKLENQLFLKRSQYIRVKNPLHKQSKKAYMCFKTRRASTRNYTVDMIHAKSLMMSNRLRH